MNKTMDVREKLVEILADLDCNAEHCKDCEFAKDIDGCVRRQKEIIADRLIAHGVTVQEWISVKDRLPKDREWVLVNHTGYATPKKAKYKDDFSPHLPVFLIDGDNGNKGEVTHWMPMPNLPSTEGSK